MMGRLHVSHPRKSVSAVGPWMSAAMLHVTFFAVAAGLCLLVLGHPVWLSLGLLLAAGGTFLPDLVSRWWVLLVLGVSQLWREPSVSDVAFYLLLAGVHLLHVIGSLAEQLPWYARIQRVALTRPIWRFVLVQLVVQTVAVGALFVFGGGRGTLTGLSIVAAAALGLVAAVLAGGLRRARGHD